MILVRLAIQTVVLALGQIWANKVRALLTTLGIVIGVAAVVGTIAAVGGLRDYVLTEFETFGAKKVFFDGRVPRRLRGTMSWMSVQLKLEEVHAVQKNALSIDRVSPIFTAAYDLQAGPTVVRTVQVQGVWPDWHEIEGRFAVFGRTLNSTDEEQRLNVCLINEKAIEELQLDTDPTNDILLVGGRRFVIVGVVETKQQGPMFGGGDTQVEVYIPLSTAMAM
jgi:putative ABC transport system permease protein